MPDREVNRLEITSKKARQDAIRMAVQTGIIQTQTDLVNALTERGFTVSQGTVSRDMKEMRLTKILTPDGVTCYALPAQVKASGGNFFKRIFRDSVLEAKVAQNMVVVKTLSGSANMVAEAIDGSSWREVVGTLAGDNTIFVATRSMAASEKLVRRIQNLLEEEEETV